MAETEIKNWYSTIVHIACLISLFLNLSFYLVFFVWGGVSTKFAPNFDPDKFDGITCATTIADVVAQIGAPMQVLHAGHDGLPIGLVDTPFSNSEVGTHFQN